MDETGVLNLIEELSMLIEDSKPAFGKSGLRQVDAQAAFEILDEIRDTFPSEFAQARQVIRERQALLDEAEAQASRLIEDASSQALLANRKSFVFPSSRQTPFWRKLVSSSAKPALVLKISQMRYSVMWNKALIPR